MGDPALIFGAIGCAISILDVALRASLKTWELWQDFKDFWPRMAMLELRIITFQASLRLTLLIYESFGQDREVRSWEHPHVLHALLEGLPNAIETTGICYYTAKELMDTLPNADIENSALSKLQFMRENKGTLQKFEEKFHQQMKAMKQWQSLFDTALLFLSHQGIRYIGDHIISPSSPVADGELAPLYSAISSPIQEDTSAAQAVPPEQHPLASANTGETLIESTPPPTPPLTLLEFKKSERFETVIMSDNQLDVHIEMSKHFDQVHSWAVTGAILACRERKLQSLSKCIDWLKSCPVRQPLELTDNTGLSAIHHAFKQQPHQFSLEIVRKLLKHGASLEQQEQMNDGYYPLHYCVMFPRCPDGVKEILKSCPHSIDFTDTKGRTALFLAVLNRDAATTKLLLEYGGKFANNAPPRLPDRFLASKEDRKYYRCLEEVKKHADRNPSNASRQGSVISVSSRQRRLSSLSKS